MPPTCASNVFRTRRLTVASYHDDVVLRVDHPMPDPSVAFAKLGGAPNFVPATPLSRALLELCSQQHSSLKLPFHDACLLTDRLVNARSPSAIGSQVWRG